ncbi:MAG: 3-phosphoshikimate 1-carboxyvinyltransferase [Clostridiales bacterium]|nr:3-phosphoshikimate 1-carboxyvinyltransferase [Clostridiales bacterium]
MNVTVYPGPLRGAVEAPPSKSHAHRLLICAALADRGTVLGISGLSNDIEATIRCLRALGAGIEVTDNGISVTPIVTPVLGARLDCGESGSTLRFLMPLAAHLNCGAVLTGEGRLPDRPNDALLDALLEHGAAADGRRLPIALSGGLTGGEYHLPGNVSSQYFTGLMLALPLVGGDSEIVATSPLESEPYVDMTLDALRQFGVIAERTPGGFHVPGGQRYRSPGRAAVEGDWSGAAFWLAANALGGRVEVLGLNPHSAQGDRAAASIFRDLREVDVSRVPDLMPALAAVMALAPGEHRIVGAARLRIKESDRLRAMAEVLSALGGGVEELPDGLRIRGGRLRGGAVSSFGDHRVAMAAAIAATACEGPVTILGAEAADKSYPHFFRDFARLGGKIDVEHHRE